MGVPVNEIDQMGCRSRDYTSMHNAFPITRCIPGGLQRRRGSSTLSYDKQNTSIKDPSEWFEVASEEARIEDVTWHMLRPGYNNDMTALRFVEMVYYILRNDGAYGCVSLWRGDRTGHVRQFTIADGEGMRRTEDCLSLFQCSPTTGCSDFHSTSHMNLGASTRHFA